MWHPTTVHTGRHQTDTVWHGGLDRAPMLTEHKGSGQLVANAVERSD
jgi:hypothetical protein